MEDTFTGVFPKELLIKNKSINAHLHLFLCESNEDDNLEFSQVKKYSDEDKIKARRHYEDPVSFLAYFKINNPLNFLYKFNTNDSAFIRRILILPFNYYFRKTTDYDYKKTDKYCRILDKSKSKELDKYLDHILLADMSLKLISTASNTTRLAVSCLLYKPVENFWPRCSISFAC